MQHWTSTFFFFDKCCKCLQIFCKVYSGILENITFPFLFFAVIKNAWFWPAVHVSWQPYFRTRSSQQCKHPCLPLKHPSKGAAFQKCWAVRSSLGTVSFPTGNPALLWKSARSFWGSDCSSGTSENSAPVVPITSENLALSQTELASKGENPTGLSFCCKI